MVNRQRTVDLERSLANLNRAVCFLRAELEARAVASDAFPSDISCSQIRASVARYEDEISAATKRCVCCSCGELVSDIDIYRVDNEDPLLLSLLGSLDPCG